MLISEEKWQYIDAVWNETSADVRVRSARNKSNVLQSQKAVSVYFTMKQTYK